MKLIRLTHLGNLTLQNLLNLDNKYRENAKLKRAKLEKLWKGKDMQLFQELFSSYQGREVTPVIQKDGQLYIRSLKFNEDFALSDYFTAAIQRFEEMGLVESTRKSKNLTEIIKSDKEGNPIRGVRRATVELTGLCNLKCKHCYRGGSREGEYGIETDKIIQALIPLLRAGITNIYFTGGEPTLRKEDMLIIIDYISQFLEFIGVPTDERMK